MRQFLHSGPLGDLLYSLCAVQAMGGGVLYTHKLLGDFLRPLLERQAYISEVRAFEEYLPRRGRQRTIRMNHEPLTLYSPTHGELINLDRFKAHRTKADRAAFYSPAWYVDMLQELSSYTLPNFEEPWITLKTPPVPQAPIVICCTPAYHDIEELDWSLLTDYSDHIIFHGFPRDYAYFTDRYNIRPRCITSPTALDLAELIGGSKLFIGNLSGSYAMAECMKHPRALETCASIAPLGGPVGPGGTTTLTREALDACVSA